jgi:hypothetical protein
VIEPNTAKENQPIDTFPDLSRFVAAQPFSAEDTTAGVENELQAVVSGSAERVDLPISIRESNYFKNIIAEAKSGNASHRAVTALELFLENNPTGVWENSWVRFRRDRLSRYANEVFERDLLADKRVVFGPQRTDRGLFSCRRHGEDLVRIPISYLLKLALADVISQPEADPQVVVIGDRIMGHLLSDNTSPETFSFSPMPVTPANGLGRGIVDETLIRFALCQFLTQYANRRFGLIEAGQRAQVYFAPNPPTRQKTLNALVTDAFYRELFMSPCLSGWDQGEEKKHYMALCHRVLSLSQLNGLYKLKEAGILQRNLVVLPSTSNTSLANNGTHISFGSRLLTGWLADPDSGFDRRHEKYVGDLVIKITEHFLPLFVGLYSAAPYRLDFQDFHPERLLGFLPHQLEATHLKMIWRRWKQKAKLRFLGQPMTPFGPEWLDRQFSRLLRIKGDFLPDYRLLDYFVCLLSTEQSPALNGVIGNDIRLKQDLTSMGIFDNAMSAYLLCRLREFDKMGFSGFEGRHYSQFMDIGADMTHAVNLQLMITALAYRYALNGEVTHRHIPDEPFLESERRQVFFGAAIGLPTFFVRKDTRNRFLADILRDVRKTRASRRYDGFVRVPVSEYLAALVRKIRRDGGPLIEAPGLQATLSDLEQRLASPQTHGTAGRLTAAILNKTGADQPMKLNAATFNQAAEQYYRNDLKRTNLQEALAVLADRAARLDSMASWRRGTYNRSLMKILAGRSAADFVAAAGKDAVSEQATMAQLIPLILLTLLVIDHQAEAVRSTSKPD